MNWGFELCRSPPKHCDWLLVAGMARTGPHCCHGNQYCGAGTAEVWAVLARRGDQGVWSIQSHPCRPARVCGLHHQAAFCLCEFDDHVQYVHSLADHFFSHGQHYMLQPPFNCILVCVTNWTLLTALNVPAIIGVHKWNTNNIYGHALGVIPCIYWLCWPATIKQNWRSGGLWVCHTDF